ncbi:MAG: DNA mismatch repair protein MutS [Deltaproteobacteria bacterium]|nr:DNA mismatch repair protein MutS [Deltaproteobacteria bacterium]
MSAKTTPVLRQYLALKDKHPDCLLFFRMGDFYELFFEDAKVAAAALEITLTSRNKADEEPVPMCGMPHHSAKSYIARLVETGFKVAICEQMEDPKTAQGLVKREIVQIITQGTFTDPDHLPAKENSFLAAVDPDAASEGRLGLAYLDLSTGQFGIRQVDGLDGLAAEISRLAPAEILLPEAFRERDEFNALAAPAGLGPGGRTHVEFVEAGLFDRRRAARRILEHFKAPDLQSLKIDHLSAGLSAAGAVLAYVAETQKLKPDHVVNLEIEEADAFLQIDEITQRHLELFSTLTGQRGKGTLIHVLDRTNTAMGGRMLRRWLANPLCNLEAIRNRARLVAAFHQAVSYRGQLRELLRRVADLERLCGRIVMNQASPKEVGLLRDSVSRLDRLKTLLGSTGSPALAELAGRLDTLDDLAAMIGAALVDEPPLAIKEGEIIRPGYRAELDELVNLKTDSQAYIAALEERERQRTGIATLKIRYNKVFGYYLEVSKSKLKQVPDDYRRKQTLTGSERFTTLELSAYEEKVLSAGAAQVEMEHHLFVELRQEVARQAARIKAAAGLVARIDALACLAEVAQTNNYHQPRLEDSGRLEFKACRHPVVEATLPAEPFVPNDIIMDMTDQQIVILTGPNMAGKSTILRQAALAVIMAQMGGFVPAEEARLGLVDQVFTRVGAGDELAKGRSTFLVEMSEAARILTQATPRSLVILDEIGRGTSTFDGLSLAWAVAEYLHDLDGQGVKTLMATHYHELVELASVKPRVKNYNVAVKKVGLRIVFLRTLSPGGVSRSYGIEVARLAGLPAGVIERAREVLAGLEEGAPRSLLAQLEDPAAPSLFVDSLPPDLLRQRLGEIETERLTPLEALNLLAELKGLR